MTPSSAPPADFLVWEDVPSLVGSIRTRSLVARPTTVEGCREVLRWARRTAGRSVRRAAVEATATWP